MGLFGGGNSSSSSYTTVTSYGSTSTPNLDLSGAAGTLGVQLAPTIEGNNNATTISPNIYNAPLYITPSVNEGDAAIQAAQQTAQSQIAASVPTSNSVGSTLTTLFSGNNLYWLLGALVLLMLARGHHL